MTAVQSAPAAWPRPTAPLRSRVVYAAAHVVPVVGSDTTPGGRVDVDWDATLGYRRDIWSYGLGVADAMDTAQRGMGLDWPAAKELIQRSSADARAVGGAIACGAGTDQLDPATLPEGERGLEAVLAAYREQLEVVTGAGATVILMASRALARVARSAEDYLRVYGTLLEECPSPVVLHWLGPMFDPALTGYWGSTDVPTATATVLELVERNAAKVDGIKVSLLDADHEKDLRARLPEGVRLYTGDDYNYPELVVGDGTAHSDALLGIFAAIYPVASAAVQALDAGDDRRALDLLTSTQELARHVFEPPTFHYKTGIAFLSWLNGRQPGFSLVGGLHAGRSVPHLVQLHRLAAEAGLLVDPDLAEHRLSAYLLTQGVGA